MRCNLCGFLILYFFINPAIGSEKGLENNTAFVPTREWQIVNKGTPIPKGLHVRHNFQTGITEAKLLDPEETSDANNDAHKSLVLHPEAKQNNELPEDDKREFEQVDKSGKISPAELKAKLKEIKLSKTPFASKAKNADIQDQKTNFQGLNELKKKFENIDFGTSPDSQLLATFIEQFNIHRKSIISGSLSSEEIKSIMDILGQLEYMVHDIDNGLEFTKSGGLVRVIYPCLNGTIEEIKFEALHVLGAAVQLNPKVKEAALELEFVPSILRTLTKYGNPKLMDRCIYALGCLVRHYPAAQKVFLSHGGLEIFSQVLAEGPTSTQKRIMNLINDLIIERHELEKINDLTKRENKKQEYADVKLEEKIAQHKFCTELGKLLVETTKNDVLTIESDAVDHELLESIYECTLTAKDICKLEFRQSENQILPALNEMSNFYNKSERELDSDESEFHRHLLALVKKIQEIMFDKSHDEL